MNILIESARSYRSSGAIRCQTILSCPDCGRLTIIEHTEPGTHNGILNVLPEAAADLEGVKYLPDNVARFYRDARRAIDANIPDAAAVQLRRTLEAAAKHRGVAERNLVKSIEKLIDDGLVTESFRAAMDHIRIVGNQAAHASDESVSEGQAEQAFRFTTQLLRNLFEVPGELEKLSTEPVEIPAGLPPQSGVEL